MAFAPPHHPSNHRLCVWVFLPSNIAGKINMSAEIIVLPVVRVERSDGGNDGNGAREAVLAYWINYAAQNGVSTDGWAEMMADNLLGFLWNDGFKVIPLDPRDAGYEGPDWTGEETPA